MSFADRLRIARGALSQKAAAVACDVKQQAWNGYENGKSVPGGEAIAKICSTLHVSADWLLGIDSQSPAGTVVATGGSAVAIGPGAKAAAGPADAAPADCSKCPHLKELQRLKKRLASLANG